MKSKQAEHAASGVEALIEKLRDQGVRQGQDEASRLVEEAERRADWLLTQARQQADQLVEHARKEAEALRTAGEEALKVAARDLQLEVKEQLTRSFTDQVERLVAQQMDNEDFIRTLILALAGRVSDDTGLAGAKSIQLLLPADSIGLEELRRNPQEYREGQLSRFVQSLAAEQLRAGVSLDLHCGNGIRIRLLDQDIEVDLSPAAVSELLLKHLQPRFRAMLEGVIR
ncbi:ATPase [Neptuniibacter sp. CAU 1671]|uniref:ATPase n=1 Tax=Neptuniibacter sp. CAU 1671 TaxID=3032593 RepID=UPI0023DBA215|nr:ATPase [Neptuniibacter sp. CAU 1671]MDF2181271.1 ATPase [Neptuniibacter sp. CAU 1671]